MNTHTRFQTDANGTSQVSRFIVVCPHCSTANRVPQARLESNPDAAVCGKCKHSLFTTDPLELNAGNFAAHVERSELPLVVDFWAPWCAPCRAMAPAFAQAAEELAPLIRLAKLNTENEPQLAGRFGIRSIPTLIVFNHGREMARHSGALDAASLIGWIRAQC